MCSFILKFADNLKVYYQNCRGLKTKTNDFFQKMSCCSFDVIILTETWLNSNIYDSELFDERYKVYRRDRESTKFSFRSDGGGVLIAVTKSIKSYRIIECESQIEDLWIQLEFLANNITQKICLCVVYLPPPINVNIIDSFVTHCNSVFENKNFDNIAIFGDFNLSCIDWHTISASGKTMSLPAAAIILVDFVNLNHFKQCNRVPNVNGKVLDLVLTNISNCTISNSIEVLSKVDQYHPPILTTFSFQQLKHLHTNPHSINYNFYKGDYVAIIKQLNSVNWLELFSDTNEIDDMVSRFYNVLREVIETYVPLVKPGNTSHPRWFSRNLIRRLNEKEKIRRRFQFYHNPRDEFELGILSKRCDKLAIECYNSYVTHIENKIKANPKFFWSLVKSKRQNSSSFPANMTNGSQVAHTGTDISNLFAQHFESVYTSCDARIVSPATLSTNVSTGCSFGLLKFTTSDVLKKLNALDATKGTGPDCIHPHFIKTCATSLAEPLAHIFNFSISSGSFPGQWKTAKVVPIFKHDDEQNVKNYRPISILSTFAKVFESLICPYIQHHFKNFLSTSQHGFVSGRSTNTNLALFTENLREAMDSHKQIDVIYTDFSKAFDKVSHRILLQKLKDHGFTDVMLQWFGSYLGGRNFYVVVGGYKSLCFQISSGVPQGSHLGPVLFNIFINDLPDRFKHSIPFMFADDLKIMKVVMNDEDSSMLQFDLDALNQWCDANLMNLNHDKCLHIKFTRNHHLIKSNYKIGNNMIKEVDCVRDLGVILDSKLTFVPHIDLAIKKASKMLGFIIRNSKIFKNILTRKILYNSLVRSHLEYCSLVWRPHFATHMLRLERIQKRFLWHLSYRAGVQNRIKSYSDRLKHFKMYSLANRRDLLDIVFAYKLLRNHIDCPDLLKRISIKAPRRYPRGHMNLFVPPLRRTVLGASSVIPRLCKVLNQCGKDIDIFADAIHLVRRRSMELFDS